MTRHDLRRNARKELTMSTRPVGRRGLFLGAGSLLATGVLAACSPEIEPPAPPPTGKELAEPTPVQTEEQLTKIVPEVSAAVVAADKALDVEKLAPRVSGSAVEFRTKAYAMIEKAEEWAEELRVPGEGILVPMTSVTSEFPRVAIALVEDSQDEGVPYFMALSQADAKSPYSAWGWAQQAVGVEIPMVANALVGSEQVTPRSEGLLMTPSDALALYAAVLSHGAKKDPDDLMAENPFQTETHQRIQTERKELNAGVERDEAATIHESYSVKDGEFVGLRTDDGGAIVMATLLSSRKVNIKDGATMSYAEDNKYTKVIGKKEFTSEYIREFGTHVALYIPSKEAGGQVQPIGATQTALDASGE